MRAEEQSGHEGAEREEDELVGSRVGASEGEGRLKLVMELMNVLVEPGNMQKTMEEILEEVLAEPADPHVPEEGRHGREVLDRERHSDPAQKEPTLVYK